MRRAGWFWWLVLGIPLALSYVWLPRSTPVASVCFEGLGVLSSILTWIGIRRNRPAGPLLWYLLLAGMVASVLGDAIYDYLWTYLRVDAFPSLADPFYLLSYPLTAISLFQLVRARAHGKDRAGLLDAAVVSTALGLLSWSFLVRPIAAQYRTGELDQLVALAYPVGDVLLIAMIARLLAAAGGRSVPFWMLVVAQLTRLVSDISFSVSSALGSDGWSLFDSGWLLTYILTAAAAMHPSMTVLSTPATPPSTTLTTPRLALLTAMSLLAPAVLTIEGLIEPTTIDWAAITIGSTALFLLVLARMRGLLGQMQRQAVQLNSLAHLDGLTGVPNRRSWDDALEREIAVSRRTGRSLVIGLIDLDFFKKFNDTYGHQAGDQLLTDAAANWRGQLREGDVLARYGGEEFGIIIAGLPVDEAQAIVERLRGSTPGGQTFSAGLARWLPQERADELVQRADRALYLAKATGRDRIVADTPDPVLDPVEVK
ncbi:GGDEF domain-containing protein [Actinoplanes sp. NPDC026619]|uniref:GGDEF domain-containing protein n=1 Tax=Actinoplanes sp. NPDC026619 TaxID=3155798 RepID=UPI0033C7B8F3